MIPTQITNWTPLVYRNPEKYVDPEAMAYVDFESWNDAYEWDQDPINGMLDYAQPVEETIEKQHGDCEDYALVAASYAMRYRAKIEPVGLGFCKNKFGIPRHVIAYDGDKVYSSGRITEETPEEYVERSPYYSVDMRWIREPTTYFRLWRKRDRSDFE